MWGSSSHKFPTFIYYKQQNNNNNFRNLAYTTSPDNNIIAESVSYEKKGWDPKEKP